MNVGMRGVLLAAGAAGGLAAGFVAGPAAAADDTFKGKTVNIIVGFGPGGGYDAYGRLLGRHMGEHIPGKPQVIVQNMPGAASLKAVRYLQTAAPNDGTAIVIFNFGQITSSIVMPSKKMKLDFRDFGWVGSMNRDVSVCYVWKERFKGVRNALDLVKVKNVNYGLTGVGSSSYFNQAMLLGVFDAPLKQVKGYSSSKEKQIAVERGELDGDCGEWSSVPDDWIRDNKLTFLMKSSPHLPKGMPKSIPYAGEIAPTPEKKQIVKLLTRATDIGRPFITRKDVPKDRLKTLQTSFDATMKDADLIAESEKIGREVSPLSASEVMAALEELYAIPQAVVVKAKAVLPGGSKK